MGRPFVPENFPALDPWLHLQFNRLNISAKWKTLQVFRNLIRVINTKEKLVQCVFQLVSYKNGFIF